MLSLYARADVICNANTKMGLAAIRIANDTIQISGAGLEKPVIYDNLTHSYDGHMTGLITAPGLSVSYENWYGCIHNATVTANFRSGSSNLIQTVHINQCSGGSTPDSICRMH